MQTANDILNDWLSETKEALITNYDKLGLRASGKWAETLEPFNNKNNSGFKIGIKGQEYTGGLEEGRRPNSNQSPAALKAWVGWAGSTILDQWVKDKGLTINPFAVAWSVARKGWSVPNNHNAGGLVTDVITKDILNDLNKKLALHSIGQLKSELITKLNN